MPLILSKKSKTEIKQRVTEMLEFVGLSDKKTNFLMNCRWTEASGYCKSSCYQLKIPLCDEATSALDPATTASTLTLLKNVNQTFGINYDDYT